MKIALFSETPVVCCLISVKLYSPEELLDLVEMAPLQWGRVDNLVQVSVPRIKKISGTTDSCVLIGASHLPHTLQSRGARGQGREGEQDGLLGTHEGPRHHGNSDSD